MSNLKKVLSIFIPVLLLSLHITAADDLKVSRVFSSKELDACSYTSFCMDSYGFMWIGTANGLFRFDGANYHAYRHEEADPTSISDNRILGLLRDKNNGIWVATANGLNLYNEDDNGFIRIPVKDFGKNGYIVSMTADEEGTVWFIVSGVGIFSIPHTYNGEVRAVEIPYSDMVKNANCILSSSEGLIYAATKEGYVCELMSGGTWSKIADLNSGISDLVNESEFSLLISANDGLYRMNTVTGELKHLRLPSEISITSFSEPMGQKTFIATSGTGVWAIDNNSDVAEYCSTLYSSSIDIRNSRIGAVYVSTDGSLWVGCDYFGILMFPNIDYSFLYKKMSTVCPDFNIPISSMDIWKRNTVVGNHDGMVAVVSEKGKLEGKFRIPGGQPVTSISVNDGKALLGVRDSGIWEANLSTGVLRKIVGIPGEFLSAVPCMGEDGSLYIGVSGKGLLRFDPDTEEMKWLTQSTAGNSRIPPFYTSIRASGHLLWIGLYGGMERYNTRSGEFEDIDQSPFVTGATYTVVPESDSSVLAGTSNGLIRYDHEKKEISKFTTLDGLADNDVRSIVIDGSGDIWIGTMRGISYADRDFKEIRTFIGGKGMEELAYEWMGYNPEENMIMASGRKGITSFFPDEIPVQDFKHPVKISGILIKGRDICPTTEINGVRIIEGPVISPRTLNLPFDENSISLRLSTLDFRDTANLTYFWRFSGDKDWERLPDGSDMIHLSSLAPGRYDLEYKAVDSGIDSPVSSIRINVAYPWYLTWQAKTGYAIVLIVLVILIVEVVRKTQQERVSERKMQLIMDVSHDMRSPLTLILQPLESLLNEDLRSDVRNRIRSVYRNAHRILALANQMLELKKIDYGKRRLECRLTDLSGFIGDIVEMLKPQALEKGITMTLHMNGDVSVARIDRSVLDRILVNIITNAIKYTPENGRIDVMVSSAYDVRMGDYLEIQVIDTGIGLGDYSLSDLSDRFHRLPNGQSFTEDGYGLGMEICRRYVALHHGQIKAHNRQDGIEGSVFSILIPTKKECYTSEEWMNEEEMSGNSGLFDRDDVYLQPINEERSELTNKITTDCPDGKVLLVEDDRLLREAVCSFLNPYFKVVSAQDGIEGYRIAQELIPDVIVTDVKMPNADGIQLLCNLKQNSETAHIPVVILSHKNELADRLAGWRGGAEAYIGKPFEFNELKAVISKLIDCRSILRQKYEVDPYMVSAPDSNPANLKGYDQLFMERVNAIINENVEDMNVESLAKEVGLSRSQLHRRLKEQLGISPSDLIRNIRLKRAAEMLKKGDLDITQIAYSLGFSSLPQFSTSFKRFMGCSPSEYRSNQGTPS